MTTSQGAIDQTKQEAFVPGARGIVKGDWARAANSYL